MARGCGVARSCDSAPWGHGSFPLFSLGMGVQRHGGSEAQMSQAGRGENCSLSGMGRAQDAHRWGAEVTRLLRRPVGSAAPSLGSKLAPLQIQISARLHQSR